jgi:uncharacterized protein (TIGR00369 family)
MRSQTATSGPPDSRWQALPTPAPFVMLVGSVFVTQEGLGAEEPVRFGFRVTEQHANYMGVCHGGMIATFMDITLGLGAAYALDVPRRNPTMNLSVDFLNPARLGDWVESRVQMLRHSKRSCFMQSLLVGPDSLVARGSGILRLTEKSAP